MHLWNCAPQMGLEPVAGDLNPARIPTVTWTHGPLIEIAQLVSGLNEPQFFMSHHKKKSVRDKVIGKKQTYLERNILHRQTVGHLRRQETLKYGILSFWGLDNFVDYWVEWLFQLFWGRRQRFPGVETWLTFWLLMVVLQLSRCCWLGHLAYANVLH